MIRDPFYNQIIAQLEGTLDAELFERCASDLLRKIYPTLVPMPGGTDSGMDGAIADRDGEPFPLVSTTNKDVIGNFTRNLQTYVDNQRSRRKVLLATCHRLTPQKKINLYN